jgi:excisionase family DNA binding protein
MYTLAQIATKLGKSEQTIYRWVRQGRIKAVKLPNGELRVLEEALQEILLPRETK